jgi:hypothetical protein
MPLDEIVAPIGLDRSCAATIYPVLDKPHNAGAPGEPRGLKLQEIFPPVFKVSFTIGLGGRLKCILDGTRVYF